MEREPVGDFCSDLRLPASPHCMVFMLRGLSREEVTRCPDEKVDGIYQNECSTEDAWGSFTIL